MRKITRIWLGALLLSAVLLNMAFIWRQSAATAEQSSEISGRVTVEVAKATVPDFEAKPPQEKQSILEALHQRVRTWAHALEFCLLGFLAALFGFVALRRGAYLSPVCSTVFCCLWALCDECHQRHVPGRAFEWRDVGVDTLGALCGALIASLLVWLFWALMRRRARRRADPPL